jgi:hypothetical protein
MTLGYAVFEDMESGARPEGIAGAFTAVADDPSAIHFNPAGLQQVERFRLYTCYKLLYGGLGANLHNATVVAAVPLSPRVGTLGVSIQEMGFSLSSERALTIAHGISLLRDLNFGYGLTGYNLAMKDLGQAFAFGVDVGLHARIYKRWNIGFMAHNLNMPQVGLDQKTYLPRLLNLGLAYIPAPGIVSSLDVSQEVGQSTRFAFGQEFQIVENLLTLRAGVQTEPVRMSFGLSTGVRSIQLDYALTTHPEMPLTHNLGLSIRF